MRRSMSAALVAATLLAGASGAAPAHPSKAWVRCSGGKDISVDQQIGGCTAVIGSGRESARKLAMAFSSRATAHFVKGDYRRAIQDYSQAINLDPENAGTFDNRCWTRATLGHLAEALEDCNRSLLLRPRSAPTLATRAFAHVKSGAFDSALADGDAALALDPQNPYALYVRGIARTALGGEGGDGDIAAATAVKPDIAQEFARYGLK